MFKTTVPEILFIFCFSFTAICILTAFGRFLISHFCIYHHKDILLLSISSYNESFEQDIRCALKRSTELGSVLLIVYDALTDEEEKILHKLTKDCFGVVLSSMDSIQENIKVCEEIRKLM